MSFQEAYFLWAAALDMAALHLHVPVAILGTQAHAYCHPTFDAEFTICEVYAYGTELLDIL